MKKLFFAVAVGSLLSGCVSVKSARCSTYRKELRNSTDICDSCLGNVDLVSGGACATPCDQPGKVGPMAVNYCTEAAQEVQAAIEAAAKAKADKK